MVYTYCISLFPLKMLFREANCNIGAYLINTLRSYAQLDDTHTYIYIYIFKGTYILFFFSCYLKVVPICLALINIYGSTVCIIYELAVELKPTSLLWVWQHGRKGPLCLPLAWFFGASFISLYIKKFQIKHLSSF